MALLTADIPILLIKIKIPPKREVLFYSFIALVVSATCSKYIAEKG